MLKTIALTLNDLDGQLEVLWCDYLTSRPVKWLWDLQHTRAQLAEARELHDVIRELKSRVYTMRSIVNDSAQLNPVRKEN